jgi:hypothetical protein
LKFGVHQSTGKMLILQLLYCILSTSTIESHHFKLELPHSALAFLPAALLIYHVVFCYLFVISNSISCIYYTDIQEIVFGSIVLMMEAVSTSEMLVSFYDAP